MKYQKKCPICPYQSQGTGKCSHKGCSKCIYLKHPNKCELYLDWVEQLNDDCGAYMSPTELSQIRGEVSNG